MKRAKGCFEKVGFKNFDTFTTDHYTGKERGYTFEQLLVPDPGTIVDWQGLIHEWVGYATYRMMGYI